MASQSSLKKFPGIPYGPIDLFLPIDDNNSFVIRLVLTVNVLPEAVELISVILHSGLNTDA
jgi:hypothetical protein